MTIHKYEPGMFIVNGACIAFILLFSYSSVAKLSEFQKFISQLQQSPLLYGFANLVAIVIPVVELILAVMLIFDRTRFLALVGSYYLMIMFSCYIVAITNFSDYVPCSCGGILEGMSWNEHLLFNLVFVFAAIIAVLLHPRLQNL